MNDLRNDYTDGQGAVAAKAEGNRIRIVIEFFCQFINLRSGIQAYIRVIFKSFRYGGWGYPQFFS